jgi:hypothetical protein
MTTVVVGTWGVVGTWSAVEMMTANFHEGNRRHGVLSQDSGHFFTFPVKPHPAVVSE